MLEVTTVVFPLLAIQFAVGVPIAELAGAKMPNASIEHLHHDADVGKATEIISLDPTGPKKVRAEIGQLIRLDPSAEKDGWTISAETSNGVVWPASNANHAFRVRCPGSAAIRMRKGGRAHSSPTERGPRKVSTLTQRVVQVEAVPGDAGTPVECGRPFDPPRKRLQGDLTAEYAGKGVVIPLGQQFTLVPPEPCREAWTDVRIEDPRIVKRLPDSPQGPRFEATERGYTEIDVPVEISCSPTGWQYIGRRMRMLLVVE
jgi:hypothetical protein